jgi:deazaflavin-dependent oxidoreductase (nitroreductase family)
MERFTRGLGPVMIRLVIVGVAALAAVGAVFVVGMRKKSPAVQRAVRQMNKAFWNPRSMETAGTPGAYASVVHHVGRRSGAAYHTPVVPVKTDDAFIVALPYGARADWAQNVLAAGRATITHEGATYEVDRPELVPTEEVDAYFGKSERKTHRAFRVDECLRLRRVDAASGPVTGREDHGTSRAS